MALLIYASQFFLKRVEREGGEGTREKRAKE
jgi:hypothetical protein